MLLWKLILMLFLNAFIQMIRADYYSSILGLENLLKFENSMIEILEDYLNAEEQHHNKLVKYIEQMEINSNGTEGFFVDPLSNWKSIKRVRQVLEDFDTAERFNPNSEEFLERISRHENTSDIIKPNDMDLLGASQGIARLQKIYNLETLDIANGTIGNRKVSLEMSAEDCFYLATSLLYSEDYKNSIEWLLETLRRQTQETQTTDSVYQPSFTPLHVELIMANLAHAELKNGNRKLTLLLLKELSSRDPQNAKLLQEYNVINEDIKKERILKESIEIETKSEAVDEPKLIYEMYKKTCSGKLQQTAREQRDLYCHYSHNNVPFCLIAPFKVEVHSIDPYVAVYHEAIYESEIENILKNATQNVKRSEIGDRTNQPSKYRISKQTWLTPSEHDFLEPLSQRLNDITGLSLDSAEDLQVANYGIGGHYGPHYDFSEVGDDYDGTGNRYLTALFYINKVEMGGSTAFPYLKLNVPPIRRSLLIWYDLHSSLDLDYRTLHGGCPVIKGSKWILTQWFHTLNQEFRHRCELKRDNYKSEKYSKIRYFNAKDF